jgi:hypothetical protein
LRWQISITHTRILERFPEIDPDLRVGEIEPPPDAVERLLCRRIAGHEQRELLMPPAGPGDLLLGYVSNFRCYSFHRNARFNSGLQKLLGDAFDVRARDAAFLHNEFDFAELCNIFGWVSEDGDQVSELSFL